MDLLGKGNGAGEKIQRIERGRGGEEQEHRDVSVLAKWRRLITGLGSGDEHVLTQDSMAEHKLRSVYTLPPLQLYFTSFVRGEKNLFCIIHYIGREYMFHLTSLQKRI